MRFRNLFAATAVAAATTFSAGLTASAAPTTYEDAVLANNPYVYYRLGESAGTTANDTSVNGRDGTYFGGPTLGVAGFGTASDTAASFTNSSYLNTPISSFGGSVPNSTYEFIFRNDDPGLLIQPGQGEPSTVRTLFGLINADPDGPGGRTQNQALAIEVNAAGVNASNVAGTGRIWLRDEDNLQLWANFDMGALLDGDYHHFAVTVDMSAATAAEKITFYIDGEAQSPTDAAESAALADNWLDFTVDASLAGRNVRGTTDRLSPFTVDEAALYGSTLSGAQILANAEAAGIPEPTTLGLLGIAGLGLLRRRTR